MNTEQRCDGVTRRDVLRVGGLSAFGFGLGDFLRLQRVAANETNGNGKAKACVLIWLDGGPTHLETFDPKPDAPAEVRGPLDSISSKVEGIRLNEYLERTANIMDQLAIVRSMTSPLGEHNFGTHYLMTGYKPSLVLRYPSFGATVAEVRSQAARATNSVLPPYIAVPKFSRNISGNGFLPSSTAPFSVGGNPDRPDFKVRDLDFYKGLNLTRLDRRRRIVSAFDEFSRANDAASTDEVDPDLERAYNLIASEKAKTAFDLSKEPVNVRNRYGRTGGNSIGQSCLLARRLIERGVPFVTVNSVGWDTHQNLNLLKERFPSDRNAHLPALDRAISGLISDLAERGMLDETLVVVMGEFGRTPKINTSGGRDHWPNCFSVALAGGGVRGGQVIGQSDALGERPKDNPITPSNLAATIFTLLGIDPAGELHTRDGRPVRISPDGSRVVKELIS